jgi:hypothetical protein
MQRTHDFEIPVVVFFFLFLVFFCFRNFLFFFAVMLFFCGYFCYDFFICLFVLIAYFLFVYLFFVWGRGVVGSWEGGVVCRRVLATRGSVVGDLPPDQEGPNQHGGLVAIIVDAIYYYYHFYDFFFCFYRCKGRNNNKNFVFLFC